MPTGRICPRTFSKKTTKRSRNQQNVHRRTRKDPLDQEKCSTCRLHGLGGNRKQIPTIPPTLDPVRRDLDRTQEDVEQKDPPKKPKYRLTDDAKEALKDYYDAVDTLSEAQLNFAQSTKVLEQKIEDKSVFLDIIKQVPLPAVQVSVRTIKEEEQLKNMTYREVTLCTHLPNFKRLNPNANEQMRTLAAFMHFVLYEQITGLQASQMG